MAIYLSIALYTLSIPYLYLKLLFDFLEIYIEKVSISFLKELLFIFNYYQVFVLVYV